MKTATAKELRYKASSILANIRKGHEVVITFRGKSVAVLKPFEKGKREFRRIVLNRKSLRHIFPIFVPSCVAINTIEGASLIRA